MSIPILDASVLSTGSEPQRAEFGRQLLSGFINHSAVKLFNHDLSAEKVSDVFRMVEKFFQLPVDVKKSISNDPESAQQRGWSTFGEEKTWWLESNTGDVAEPNFGDAKESYDVGSPNDKQFPNKWPQEACLPGFQTRMRDFYDECSKASSELLQVLAIALDLPQDAFEARCTNHASTLRTNHYPAIEVKQLESGQVSRVWPHYDFGIISLLFPDAVGGLEFGNRANGGFISNKFGGRGEIVILVAETLKRLSNGKIPAGLHQVTKPPDDELNGDMVPERFSIVFFCKADWNAKVGPLPQLVGQEKVKFEDITALEHQAERNKAHYPNTVKAY